jgi:hypothetical protein
VYGKERKKNRKEIKKNKYVYEKMKEKGGMEIKI